MNAPSRARDNGSDLTRERLRRCAYVRTEAHQWIIKEMRLTTSSDSSGFLDSFDPVHHGELALDPGIRRYVLVLRACAIETFESCEGGPGHACPEPMVRFNGNAFEGFKAFAVAMTHGLPVLSLRHVYDVNDMRLHGPWWEMTFRTTDLQADRQLKREQCEQSG